MNKLLRESISIGILSVFLLYIYNYISYYNNNDDNMVISCISNCVDKKIQNKKKLYNYNNYILFFIIGIFIHLIIDYLGINNINCNKVCYNDGKCELICKMPLN